MVKSNGESGKRAYAHTTTGDMDGTLGCVRVARGGTTARAEDKPPVLVGYVKKLVPDRDGGDREVGVNKPRSR